VFGDVKRRSIEVGNHSMTAKAICPACGTVLGVDRQLLQSQVRCGHCDCIFVAISSSLIGYVPFVPPAAESAPSGKAIAALVMGCIGMIVWCLPIAGFPLTLSGLLYGMAALKTPSRGMAAAGIALNSIGLVLSLRNAALGAYLALAGRHPFVR
jgi:hypothetical protein